MSTTTTARAQRPAPRPQLQLPRLRAVAPISRVPRLPFLLLTIAAIVAGVFGLVALNVSVNQQSFQISEPAQNRLAEARWTALQADVDRLKAPARIAKAAQSAKLAPAGRPRVVALPGSRGRSVATPGAATSPAAPGAGLTRGDDQSGWTAGDRSRSSATWPNPRPTVERGPGNPKGAPVNRTHGKRVPHATRSGNQRPPPRRRPQRRPLRPRRRRVNGRRRLLALLILSVLAFLAISGRLIVLQVFDAGSLDQAAARQRTTVIDLPATRGRIFDRNLNDLAISIPARSVWADPRWSRTSREPPPAWPRSSGSRRRPWPGAWPPRAASSTWSGASPRPGATSSSG